jgi:hypothetical protein
MRREMPNIGVKSETWKEKGMRDGSASIGWEEERLEKSVQELKGVFEINI